MFETIYAYSWSNKHGAFICQVLEECAFGGQDLYNDLETLYLQNKWVYIQTLINVESHPECASDSSNNVISLSSFRSKDSG